MKSGTTSLHAYLREHPQIFMSRLKEPGYFVEELNLDRGEAWYLDLFAGADGARVIGESTTDYTKYPKYRGVAERIARFNPEARFIYLMRDPVERTISHYWHAVRHRLRLERRELLTAIRDEPHYRDVSHYAMQLEPYLSLFGRDRILAVTFEEMNTRPGSFIASVLQWLGVDSGFVPPNLHERENVTPKVIRRVRGFGLLHGFRHSSLWNAVGSYVHPSLRQAGKRLAVDKVDRSRQGTTDAIAFLRPIQLEQTQRLAAILGRDFPEWRTLYDTKKVKRDAPAQSDAVAR
jgi:hypothetical protein